MPKSEIIDLILCFISIVGLLVNCYLFYRNSKNLWKQKITIINFAFCNMGIAYGMLAFVFYMFSFIVSSKEMINELHQQCLIVYIIEGLYFLIAGVIKIVSKWRMKYKSTKRKCSNCIHKKVCSITDNDENDKKAVKISLINQAFKEEYEEKLSRYIHLTSINKD